MWWLAFPFTVTCVFRKYEVLERLEPKIGGGESVPCALYKLLTYLLTMAL